jgi:hypothetical protein
LLHNGIVRPEGLFPTWFPDILVYSLLYKLRDCLVVRGLMLTKRLHLHRLPLPLSMDPLLSGLNPGGALPFEDSHSPEIYTSIFWQLWDASAGGLISNAWVEDGTIAMASSVADGAEGLKGEVETVSSVAAGVCVCVLGFRFQG